MKVRPGGDDQPLSNEYSFSLTRGRIAALVAAPLLAILVYWLTLPQGAPIAGALAVTVFAAVLWITEALPLPVTALLIPVALGILSRQHADANLSRLLLLGVAYGASIGGVATLIGSPPNAIAAGLLEIDFLEWLVYDIPVSLTMLAVAIPILWWTYRPEQKQITVALGEEAPLTENGKRTLAVVGITLLLWLFGPTLGKLLLLLLGGGLSLGRGLTESGAANWLAGLLTSSLGDLPLFVLLLMLVTIGVFATELISNTAVTANLAPILMGVAFQLGLESESLVVPVAIATSMAFMLPVATPPNALVHASGHVAQRDMMRAGLRLNLAAIAVITLLFHFGVAG